MESNNFPAFSPFAHQQQSVLTMRVHLVSSPLEKVGWDKAMTIIGYRISEKLAFCLCTHNSSIRQGEAIYWGFCVAMDISYWGKGHCHCYLRLDQCIQKQERIVFQAQNFVSRMDMHKSKEQLCSIIIPHPTTTQQAKCWPHSDYFTSSTTAPRSSQMPLPSW